MTFKITTKQFLENVYILLFVLNDSNAIAFYMKSTDFMKKIKSTL